MDVLPDLASRELRGGGRIWFNRWLLKRGERNSKSRQEAEVSPFAGEFQNDDVSSTGAQLAPGRFHREYLVGGQKALAFRATFQFKATAAGYRNLRKQLTRIPLRAIDQWWSA